MKILRFFATIVHVFIMVLLLGTLLNAYIPPKIFPYQNFLAFSFPVLMLINILFIIFWMISFKKRALVFLVLSLFLFNASRRWINYSPDLKKESDFKVLTFNVKAFKSDKEKTLEFITHQNADVVLLQECGYEMVEKIDIIDYKYTHHQPIVSIYSKHKITNSGRIFNKDNGYANFADISIQNQTLRFVNVYLQSFYLNKEMLTRTDDLSVNENKAKGLFFRMKPVFKKHQEQIQEIRKWIDQSPYPVILAGDFNAVPNSYEYFKLGENLIDPFTVVGNGFGASFHDFKIPIRIDYILSSKNIKPVSYITIKNKQLSDHYPVTASFSF